MTIALLVCAAVVGLVLLFGFDPDGTVAQLIWHLRSTGWIAVSALGLALFVSLFSRARALRRSLGITAAVVALAHAAYATSSPLVPGLELLWYEPMFRAGAVTLLILAALLLTSFGAVSRILRVRRWTALHALAPVAFVTAVHHVLLAPHARVDVAIGLAWFAAAAIVLRVVRAVSRSRR